jgi:quinol monooxygenase YgiN
MIMRMVLVDVPVEMAAEAERLWKNECAPLMISQPGCISEQLIRSRDNPGEFISLSAWTNQADIDRYRAGVAHKAILQHIHALLNVAKTEVKTYDIVKW